MTPPSLQSEIRALRQSGMSYTNIMRLLKRNFLPGRPREIAISLPEIAKICGEAGRSKGQET